MSDENNIEVSKSETDPRLKLAMRVAKEFDQAVKTKPAFELAEVPPHLGPEDWEIFAIGPYQTPDEEPHRIIKMGQKAYIAIVVWMNDAMCRNITGHGDKIELSIWTSDMQRMQPASDLSDYVCIQTERGKCWYVYVWELVPTQDACIYETNICARICSCSDKILDGYAGFVRHVYDFDPTRLWPYPPPPRLVPKTPEPVPGDRWPRRPRRAPPSWGFDRPIRYMVYNVNVDCECEQPYKDILVGPF